MLQLPDIDTRVAENTYIETLADLGHQFGLPYHAGATHRLLYLEAGPLLVTDIAQRLNLNDLEVESALETLEKISWVWRTPEGFYLTHKDPLRLLKRSLDHALNKQLPPLRRLRLHTTAFMVGLITAGCSISSHLLSSFLPSVEWPG
ncbi:hypothetical protein [Woodsholea maritima]|uniref:hypothetical protein n=1 Tax=Woodsholea maritima TaxID=240237 RepID=UPI00037809F6|nr:hypothetical protein [Woodsholea maritima]